MKIENYIQNEKYKFLGEGRDAAKHIFNAFKTDKEIHIVYNIDTPQQTIAKESLKNLQNNPHKYLWTPYAQFI